MSITERQSMWVKILSDVLNSFVKRNNKRQVSNTHASKFCALLLPKIPIHEYVSRIVLCSNCSEECFVLALIYIERWVQENPGVFVNAYNVHRLILTSVMIAHKYLDDESLDNSYYCRVGGLSLKEINELEREFLLMINFNLHVENELFTAWNNCLIDHHDWLVTTSPQYEFTNFAWEDEVASLLASMVSVPDVLTPSVFLHFGCGTESELEEISISPRLKPDCLNCGYPIWQYPNQNYSPPSYLPRMLRTNQCVQTY